MQAVKDFVKKDSKVDGMLRKEFQHSLKEESFSNLVSKLSLSEDILMKYTSRLEESALEYQHCMECKNKMECLNKVKGYALLPQIVGDSLIFQYKACKFKKKELKEEAYLKNVTTSHMPDSIRKARMKNIYTKDSNRAGIIKWLTNFYHEYQKNPHQKGLYLHGNFGCGKSYLIAAIFHELAQLNVKSAIVFWPEYLMELKTDFNSDFKEKNYFKEKMDFIKQVPLLLIDDIGAENVTPWNRDEIFCPLVQYRMDHELPTFFTSNFSLEELEHHFASSSNGKEEVKARRIVERMRQLTEDMELVSQNLRK